MYFEESRKFMMGNSWAMQTWQLCFVRKCKNLDRALFCKWWMYDGRWSFKVFFLICGDFRNVKTKNNQFRLLFHWWVQKGSHEYSKRRCALKCPTEQARISSLWSFTWGHILVMDLQRRLRGGIVCWSIYRKGRFLSWWFLGEVN